MHWKIINFSQIISVIPEIFLPPKFKSMNLVPLTEKCASTNLQLSSLKIELVNSYCSHDNIYFSHSFIAHFVTDFFIAFGKLWIPVKMIIFTFELMFTSIKEKKIFFIMLILIPINYVCSWKKFTQFSHCSIS